MVISPCGCTVEIRLNRQLEHEKRIKSFSPFSHRKCALFPNDVTHENKKKERELWGRARNGNESKSCESGASVTLVF